MQAFINYFLDTNDIFDLNLNEQKKDISKDKMKQALGRSGYETNLIQAHMGTIIGINSVSTQTNKMQAFIKLKFDSIDT